MTGYLALGLGSLLLGSLVTAGSASAAVNASLLENFEQVEDTPQSCMICRITCDGDPETLLIMNYQHSSCPTPGFPFTYTIGKRLAAHCNQVDTSEEYREYECLCSTTPCQLFPAERIDAS